MFDPIDYSPAETKPVTLEPHEELLLKAAGILRVCGWCQGQSRIGERLCLVGAVRKAALLTNDNCFEREAIANVEVFLGIPHAQNGPQVVAKWNDTPGRTKEEVIAALEGAAYARVNRR